MARLRPATAPTGLRLLSTAGKAAARRLPFDLQARARRNAWAGMAEVRAVGRARREADAALAALALADGTPERAAR